jgi:hypothetical protein
MNVLTPRWCDGLQRSSCRPTLLSFVVRGMKLPCALPSTNARFQSTSVVLLPAQSPGIIRAAYSAQAFTHHTHPWCRWRSWKHVWVRRCSLGGPRRRPCAHWQPRSRRPPLGRWALHSVDSCCPHRGLPGVHVMCRGALGDAARMCTRSWAGFYTCMCQPPGGVGRRICVCSWCGGYSAVREMA